MVDESMHENKKSLFFKNSTIIVVTRFFCFRSMPPSPPQQKHPGLFVEKKVDENKHFSHKSNDMNDEDAVVVF
jgi:hypothetical protein